MLQSKKSVTQSSGTAAQELDSFSVQNQLTDRVAGVDDFNLNCQESDTISTTNKQISFYKDQGAIRVSNALRQICTDSWEDKD